MEIAVLYKLQHILPVFSHTKKVQAWDNIITLLLLTDEQDSKVVFIDLEKAFELTKMPYSPY